MRDELMRFLALGPCAIRGHRDSETGRNSGDSLSGDFLCASPLEAAYVALAAELVRDAIRAEVSDG